MYFLKKSRFVRGFFVCLVHATVMAKLLTMYRRQRKEDDIQKLMGPIFGTSEDPQKHEQWNALKTLLDDINEIKSIGYYKSNTSEMFIPYLFSLGQDYDKTDLPTFTHVPVFTHKGWTLDMYEEMYGLQTVDAVASFLLQQLKSSNSPSSLLLLPSYEKEWERFSDPKTTFRKFREKMHEVQHKHPRVVDQLPIETTIFKWQKSRGNGHMHHLSDEETVTKIYTRLCDEGRSLGLESLFVLSEHHHPFDSVRKKMNIASSFNIPIYFLDTESNIIEQKNEGVTAHAVA